MDNTRETAKLLLRTLVAQGFEPPAIMHQKGGADEMADDWSRLLNFAGVTAREAVEALARYIVEPNATQYRKPWPDVGMLVARSDPGRLAASLGSDADTAWHDFWRRLRSLFPDGPGKWTPLDEDDARDRAMAAGLRAIGGTSRVREMSDEDRERFAAPRWKAAYVAERKRQAGEPREVRAMLTAAQAPRMLEGK